MKAIKDHALALTLVIANFVVSAVFYGTMPDPVPTHWDVHGVADGFTPKPWGAFLQPLIAAFVLALLVALPRLSPKGFSMEPFARSYSVVVNAVVGLLFALNLAVSLSFAGVAVDVGLVVPIGVGLLFVVIGNYMGKFTRNFFAGIRTPWTLASEEVWLRTHRLGGKMFVLLGLVLMSSALLPAGARLPALVGATALAVLVPVVYSYVLYRRLEGTGG